MGAVATQITSLTIVYSTIYSVSDQKKNIKAPRHWPLCGEFTGDQSKMNAVVQQHWRHYEEKNILSVSWNFMAKLVTGEFPAQRANNVKMFPFDDKFEHVCVFFYSFWLKPLYPYQMWVA